jgi:hypothetical protein
MLHRSGRFLGRIAPVMFFGALLIAPVSAADKETAVNQGPVIPPGQEEVLAAMLGKGAALPDNCKLASADVDHTAIKATYTCPGGEVVFQLTHPSAAPAGAKHTDRFAITLLSGTPPAALQPALEALIRAKESAFKWKSLTLSPTKVSRRRVAVAAAVAGLVGIAAVQWVRRRRRSAEPPSLS